MDEIAFSTSGSTGASKRIVRTEASLGSDAARLVAAFPEVWSGRPYVIASVHPEHMYGALWVARAPALVGCPRHSELVFSVEELLAVCETRGDLLFVTTPSFLEKALTHPDFSCLYGAFRAIVTSGSLLRAETSRAVREATGICPLEIYGSTETGTVAWRRQTTGEAWTLMDGVNAVCAEDGCIRVDSPFAMARPFALHDRVTFLDACHFLLHGRADRQVKILETFVALGHTESVLAQHRYVDRVRVEAFGEGVPRLGALIVPSAAGREALARTSFAAVSAELRADVRGRLDAPAFPRRIRFVRALPANEQGKITVEAVLDTLSAWCPEPVVLSWSATSTRLEATLAFPPDMTCFKGHFPGRPVLPGVAQLYFLRHFAHQAFADFPDVCTWRRLKFKQIVEPGMVVGLSVGRTATGSFVFALGEASGGEVVSA